MKLIQTSVTTKPNTNVEFWDNDYTELSLPTINLIQEEMLANGRIISITKTISEDQLTCTVVKIYASIDDYVYSNKQKIIAVAADGEEYFKEAINNFKYMSNNGITETLSWAFEA